MTRAPTAHTMGSSISTVMSRTESVDRERTGW
jgi:hypothetical protein